MEVRSSGSVMDEKTISFSLTEPLRFVSWTFQKDFVNNVIRRMKGVNLVIKLKDVFS